MPRMRPVGLLDLQRFLPQESFCLRVSRKLAYLSLAPSAFRPATESLFLQQLNSSRFHAYWQTMRLTFHLRLIRRSACIIERLAAKINPQCS